MEVSKINYSVPVAFKKEQYVKENEQHSTNPQKTSTNTNTIALSLIGLGALGAAFVLGRKTGKVKEIVKEIKTEVQTVADDAAQQIKNSAKKADDAAETVFKNVEEFYPSGKRKFVKVVDEKTGESLSYTEYFENGVKKQFTDYKTKITTNYYPNGNKAKVYDDALGVTRTYYPDGVLKSVGQHNYTKYYTKEGILSKRVEIGDRSVTEYDYMSKTFTYKSLDANGNVTNMDIYNKGGIDKSTELKNGRIFKETEHLKGNSEKVRVFDINGKEVYSSTITREMKAMHKRQMINKARKTGEGLSSFTDGGMYVEHPTTTHHVLSHTIDKVVYNMKDKVKTVTQYFGKGIQQEKVYDISGKKPKLTKLTLTRQDGTKKVTEFLPDGTKNVTELPAEVKS